MRSDLSRCQCGHRTGPARAGDTVGKNPDMKEEEEEGIGRRPVVWFLPLSLPIPSSGGVNGHKQSASDNFNSLTPTLFLSRPQSSHLLPDQSPLLLGCQGIRRCNIFWCPVASVSRYLLFVPFYSPRSPGRRPHKVTRVGPPWILAKRSGPM